MDLDDVVPAPEHTTSQTRVIAAPPEVVWEELHRVTLSSLPISATLIGIRFLPALLLGSRPSLDARSWTSSRCRSCRRSRRRRSCSAA